MAIKTEMEPTGQKFSLPENLRLPDNPTREEILLFLGRLALAWDDLTPEQLQQAFNYFDQKTRNLEK